MVSLPPPPMTRLLLRNGRVHAPAGTGTGAGTGAGTGVGAAAPTCLLVEGDTLAWVGTEDGAPPPRPGDRVVDLQGRLVTPAFVDAHVHLADTGLNAMGADLTGTRSAAEALDLLAVHARTTGLGIVLGQSWDETTWTGSMFSRAELDAAVAGRPAYVSRVDMHSAFASTALLEVAGQHAGTPVEGMDGWSAQGPVSRDAHHAVRDAVRTLMSPADRALAIRLALQTAAARGIGMVHEMGAPHINSPGDVPTARRLRAEADAVGSALPEVVGYWGEPALDLVLSQGLAGAAGDYCVDGAIGSRTAALEATYADAAGNGHLYLDAAQIADHLVACTRAGVQGGFHVIGDRGAAALVDGFTRAAAEVGADAMRSARHRLEHLEMVSAAQIEVLADLGATASMQPLFDAWWGGPAGLYETRLGERAHGMNAFASLARAGVPLAFGSDSPVTPFDPWAAVRAAVWHHDPAERLGVTAALDAHTRGGWLAARRDGGTLEPGAPAYVAVWDLAPGTDPLTRLDPDDALPACALTLVAGAPAHDPEGLLS